MLKIGWFSTGNGKGSLGFIRFLLNQINKKSLNASLEFVFCNREFGEAAGSDEYINYVTENNINLVTLSSNNFQKKNKWNIVERKCRDLTKKTLISLQEILKTNLLSPVNDNWLGQMASIQLPIDDSSKIKNILLNNFNIEIPIFQWENKNMLRFSFNAYNDENDSIALIDAIKYIF